MPSENFYSPHGRPDNYKIRYNYKTRYDYKIRYAFKSSPFWGASMKDFQKFSNLSTESFLAVRVVLHCYGSFDTATPAIRHSDDNSSTGLANSYVHSLR